MISFSQHAANASHPRLIKTVSVCFVLIVSIGLFASVSDAQNQVRITEFQIKTPVSNLQRITTGPDGNLWFTENGGHKVGRITTGGKITEFALASTARPQGITTGHDNNLWVTDVGRHLIVRITPSGVMRNFVIPTANSLPWDITSGADGALWFTEARTSKIGRISITGAVTEFPLPGNVEPRGITAGPDGNLWFTEARANKIGRITLAGVVTEFVVPTANSRPFSITAGPDGNLWFTEFYGNKIGRITPDGVITEFAAVPDRPTSITASLDGHLWFTALEPSGVTGINLWFNTFSPSGVIRVNFVGEAQTYRPNLSGPQSITVGPDANLWVIESGGKIARVHPPPRLPSFSAYETDGLPQGVTTGPDGKIWFTQIGPPKIGRIESDGSIVLFTLPSGYRYVGDIIAGPDGNLWFTARKDGSRTWLWRITPAGVMTEFPIPSDSYIFGLAAGPDGNIWFTEYSTHKIGRITPAGVVTEFPTPSNPSSPQGIVAGPDGNLWFTELGRIGRINPAGVVFSPHHLPTFTITEFQVPRLEPRKITVGPDGNLWFTDESYGGFGILNPQGEYLGSVPLRSDAYSWINIASAQDGRVWFGNSYGLLGNMPVSGSATFFDSRFGLLGIPALAPGPEGTLLIATHEERRVIVLNVATVSPFADGYVRQSQSTSSFGFANELQSKRAAIDDPDGHRAAFLLFDLSRFSSVRRAKLRLFGQVQAPASSNATIGTAILPLSNMTWKEPSLTWGNMPLGTLTATPLNTINVSSTTRQWYEVDITDFVRAEKMAGRNVVGIVLRNVSEGPSSAYYTSFDSREAEGTAPQLVVTSY